MAATPWQARDTNPRWRWKSHRQRGLVSDARNRLLPAEKATQHGVADLAARPGAQPGPQPRAAASGSSALTEVCSSSP